MVLQPMQGAPAGMEGDEALERATNPGEGGRRSPWFGRIRIIAPQIELCSTLGVSQSSSADCVAVMAVLSSACACQVVHLKRFLFDGYHRDKIETLVDFPLQGEGQLDASDWQARAQHQPDRQSIEQPLSL